MKPPARGMAPEKHVILFLAADPLDTDRLALDREARAIQLELKRSGYRDRFEFVTWWAAEPLDLLRALRERPPTIVHFSGHGMHSGPAHFPRGRDVAADSASEASARGGLAFVNMDGRGKVVTPAAFGQAIAAAGAQVRIVVLNACFTAPMAQALAAHVDCVVGMTGSIHDDAARIFSIGFYGGLGEQRSVAEAFAHGTAAINLEGLADVDQPQLVVRDGFDAARLIPAAMEPSLLVAVPCPYPGMRPFTAEDTDRFHGRKAEINDLIGRLRTGEREIFVIGPSGSGKSSLVKAGVLPRLARGVSGLAPCVVREMRPGEQPKARLGEALEVPDDEALVVPERVAALLAHRPAAALLVMVVDQLEELFTLAGADERAAFLEALRSLQAQRRCAVVFTLRADFFGALMESDLWAERHGKLSRIEVSPLRGKALEDAIAAPAAAVGVTVERELILQLRADAASEPGILPLLQETMMQLWDARVSQTLTLAEYQALGDGERSGLSVALARRAAATMRRFDAAQTDVARRILLRLISFGEGRSDTRRQQSRAQLQSAGDDAAAFGFVLQAMVEDRLLTVDDDVAGDPQVDLSHEALITAWPELRRWTDERRADGLRRRWLEAQVGAWIERGRGRARLLDAAELAEAEKWRASDAARELGQPGDLAALVAASLRRQRVARRRTVAAVLTPLVLIAGAIGLAWWNMRQRRAEQDRDAQSQADASHRLAQTALARDHEPVSSLRLAAAALELASPSHPRRQVMQAQAITAALQAPIQTLHIGGPSAVAALTPDERVLVVQSPDGAPSVWDLQTLNELPAPRLPSGWVRERPAFDIAGTRVVVTVHVSGKVRMWTWILSDPTSLREISVDEAGMSPDREVTFIDDQLFVVRAESLARDPLWASRLYSKDGPASVRLGSGRFPAKLNDGRTPMARVGSRMLALLVPEADYRVGSRLPDRLQAVDVVTGEQIYDVKVAPFIDAAWIPERAAVVVELKASRGPDSPLRWAVLDLTTGKQTTPMETVETAQCASQLDWPRIESVGHQHILVRCGNVLHSLSFDADRERPFENQRRVSDEVDPDGELWQLAGVEPPAVWLTGHPELAVSLDSESMLKVYDYTGVAATQRSVGGKVVFSQLTSSGTSVVTLDDRGSLRWWPTTADWDRCSDRQIFDLSLPRRRSMYVPPRSGRMQGDRAVVVRMENRAGCRVESFDLATGRKELAIDRDQCQLLFGDQNELVLEPSFEAVVDRLQHSVPPRWTTDEVFHRASDGLSVVALYEDGRSDGVVAERTLRLPASSLTPPIVCPPAERGKFLGFTGDGAYALHGSDASVNLWSTETCDVRASLAGYAELGSNIDYEGGSVVAALKSSAVSLLADGHVVLRLKSGATWSVSRADGGVLHPSGEAVVLPPVAGPRYPGTRWVMVADDGTWVAVLANGTAYPHSVDGQTVRTLRIVDTRTGYPVFTSHEPHREVLSSRVTANRANVQAITSDGTLLTCVLDDGATEGWLPALARVSSGFVSPSSSRNLSLAEFRALRSTLCLELSRSSSRVALMLRGRLEQLKACIDLAPGR